MDNDGEVKATRMVIIWLSWKDINHPKAGGAERISHSILTRLADDHHVTLLTSNYPGSGASASKLNYNVIHLGNRYSCYFLCTRYFVKNLMETADLVIEEVNTLAFFASKFFSKSKFLLFHQLGRKLWFYEVPILIGIFGFIFERLSLYILKRVPALAMSESTRSDLLELGFTNVAEPLVESVEVKPLKEMNYEFKGGQILSFGSFRPMKRTLHQIRAFELARDKNLFLNLIVVGSGSKRNTKRILSYVEKSRHRDAIRIIGYVDEATKAMIMESSDVLLQTSVVEGWGLTVTEAGRCGTPTIAYDVSGLRDSVVHRKTGLLTTSNNPRALANAINEFFDEKFDRCSLSTNAYDHSLKFSPDATFQSFKKAILINGQKF